MTADEQYTAAANALADWANRSAATLTKAIAQISVVVVDTLGPALVKVAAAVMHVIQWREMVRLSNGDLDPLTPRYID